MILRIGLGDCRRFKAGWVVVVGVLLCLASL